MTIDNQISEIVQQVLNAQLNPLRERIAELETRIKASKVKEVPEFLTRKHLSEELSVSERFIADNPDFKAIERKVGGRILYPWAEVQILLNYSINNGRIA